MKNINAKELLIKYQQGSCTAEELALLETWYLEYRDEKELNLTTADIENAKANVWASLPLHQTNSTRKLWPLVSAAASVIIVIAVGLLFFRPQQTPPPKGMQKVVRIVPGGNKALLTLADGTKISLTDAANGQLANQAGLLITKAKDGQLVYTVSEKYSSEKQEVAYNTISTPRGGFYQVNLPDGTKVWLNAASSLKYPTIFTGSERKVELTGEGYFEVAHNASRPFRVASASQVIEVLGTHFNISAYEDDVDIRTTLLSGSVRVNEQSAYTLLRPGEQGINYQRRLSKVEVNTDNVIAWKSNNFTFDHENLGSILRKISRWYDVDVVCPPEMEDMKFDGTISRQRSIKSVLRIMELTETVHFKFEGRRITVMP